MSGKKEKKHQLSLRCRLGWQTSSKIILAAGMAIAVPAVSLYGAYLSAPQVENAVEDDTQKYKAVTISNLEPVDILPIIGQIESGDKQAYEHIEHLRIAEATRIRDMMWKYGAGQHSPAEYQQLMSRLNTGMTMEIPGAHDNFETIGGNNTESTSHANIEGHILNTLIKHANFKVIGRDSERNDILYSFTQSNPNSINIFGNSWYFIPQNKNDYLQRDITGIKNLCQTNNFLIFVAGTNIRRSNGVMLTKIYNGDFETDENGEYSLASIANSKNDASANCHMIVTIGTDADGDIDQTNEKVESSKWPVGFHNDVLFSGRAFPFLNYETGKIYAEGEGNHGKYATSYTNYLNVAIADLCFQMFAEVQNVDQLLDMIRSSTLTDYIRFNGETQNLHLMNPAGFIKKYLMPENLPTEVKSNETVALEKGYYKGIIFNIPGAEVLVDGEWIACTQDNADKIKAQNPMNLEWRLNGGLLSKYGYKKGDTVSGQLVAVDDEWNGLSLVKDITFTIDDASAISTPMLDAPAETWYTVDGHRLSTKPSKPGIYIVNGKKVTVK